MPAAPLILGAMLVVGYPAAATFALLPLAALFAHGRHYILAYATLLGFLASQC
ncbi:MAG: hypothetical protein KF841_03040 [Phycisphaerae bacterium]|nr:hypothetical protein [Phycisphaerae bacterium]